MTTGLTPRRQMRSRVALPRAQRPHRVDSRSQQVLMHELAQLPPARRGPALRPGTRIVRPSLTRRRQQPMMPRLLAGEFQRLLVLALLAATIFVVVVVALGGSLFV